MSYAPHYQAGWVPTFGTSGGYKYDLNAHLVPADLYIVHLEPLPTSGGSGGKAKSLPGEAKKRFPMWSTALNVSGLVTMVGGFFSGHSATGWIGGLCYGGGVVMQLLTSRKDYWSPFYGTTSKKVCLAAFSLLCEMIPASVLIANGMAEQDSNKLGAGALIMTGFGFHLLSSICCQKA